MVKDYVLDRTQKPALSYRQSMPEEYMSLHVILAQGKATWS